MKESDRKFEKLLKEAVCSYHKEEMDALPSEEELQDIQLSDDFYRKMDGLVKKQKRRWQYRFVRYGAVAASFLLFTFGTVGAAAYALMGAENFKAFFKKHAKEYHVADSAVMDLEQLTDMAVTTAGTVYEDDNIRLDLKGLIKSGNRFSMIVEGTLKQQDQIVTAGGPQEEHAYSFLNTDVNAEQDLMASGTYYYQEDDKSLASNQFVYVTNYSAEAGLTAISMNLPSRISVTIRRMGQKTRQKVPMMKYLLIPLRKIPGYWRIRFPSVPEPGSLLWIWIRQRIFPIRRSVIRPSLMEKMTSRLIA